MHNLKVLTAAVALLFATPVLAQEMGGATGPGSASGLEATYNNGYYNGYGQGEHLRARGGALDGNNSYALSPGDVPSDIGRTIQRPEPTRAMMGGAIPANRLKSRRRSWSAAAQERGCSQRPGARVAA
jgi:hypothetical protein